MLVCQSNFLFFTFMDIIVLIYMKHIISIKVDENYIFERLGAIPNFEIRLVYKTEQENYF